MASSIALGMSALIWAVGLYWVYQTGVFGWLGNYIWGGITTGRALTVGGFVGGLMVGDALVKMALTAVGGVAVLGLGDVISLPAEVFGVIVLFIVVFFALTGGDD
jgi:hypothetical protein